MTPRPTAYLAMPFRPSDWQQLDEIERAMRVDVNVQAAIDQALCLIFMGYAVLCPHTNSCEISHRRGVPDTMSEEWIEMGCDLIRNHRPDRLLVYCGPGWERSEGAKREAGLAEELGIRVVRYPDEPPTAEEFLSAQCTAEPYNRTCIPYNWSAAPTICPCQDRPERINKWEAPRTTGG